jgi:hypothetical protein
MRRRLTALAQRLGALPSAGSNGGALAPSTSAGALPALGLLSSFGIGAVAGGSGVAVAAAAACRTFSSSAAAPSAPPHYASQPRRGAPPPPDPDSDLGRLEACGSADEMREWRQALQDEGRLGTAELAAAMRRLGLAQGLTVQERGQYGRELIALALDSGMQLDGKAGEHKASAHWECMPKGQRCGVALRCTDIRQPLSSRLASPQPQLAPPLSTAHSPPHPAHRSPTAAYLVWLPAKVGWRGNDPTLQRVLPAVYALLDSMRVGAGGWAGLQRGSLPAGVCAP